jgi:hypothetical protein
MVVKFKMTCILGDILYFGRTIISNKFSNKSKNIIKYFFSKKSRCSIDCCFIYCTLYQSVQHRLQKNPFGKASNTVLNLFVLLVHQNSKKTVEVKMAFLLSIYDSNESIDFVHGKSKIFYWSSGRIRTFYRWKNDFWRKKIFRRSAVCRLSTNFVIRITFFPFNLDTSPFQVKVFWA